MRSRARAVSRGEPQRSGASERRAQRNLSRQPQGRVAYQKVAPFKVFDNLYYIGPGFVSVWLIPTNEGLILIDAAQEPYVDHVIDGIRKVGFDPPLNWLS